MIFMVLRARILVPDVIDEWPVCEELRYCLFDRLLGSRRVEITFSLSSDILRYLEDSRSRSGSEVSTKASAFYWPGATCGDSDIVKLERIHSDSDVYDSDVGSKGGREGWRWRQRCIYDGRNILFSTELDWFVCLLLASLISTTTEQY